ncbi:MAG: hypothetical protein CMO61_01960 [Verrucomicrobiales bacterium]|nr:hypothetical protein [Verrucomicrobiales bacterium]|tara:strand:+ start:11054 stop:12022 length:969 start_codon:yes stop_codon:yes gene_type:complete
MNPEEEHHPQQPEAGESQQGHSPPPHEDAQPGVYDDLAHQPPGSAQFHDPNQAYVDPVSPAPPESHTAGVYDGAQAPQPVSQPASAGMPRRRAPRKVTKKKIVTRRTGGVSRRGGAPSRKTSYQRPTTTYGGGGMMNVFIGLVGAAMLVLVLMVLLPKDLSGIAGYPANRIDKSGPRNLLSEAQGVMVSQSEEVAISEADLNTYINHRIQGDQEGLMGSIVSFDGIYVDLLANGAEVYVLRSFFGMPVTLTSRIRADSFRYQMRYEVVEFTIGKIRMGSGNIKPVIDMFGRIKGGLQEEEYTLNQLGEIRFEDDQVILSSKI